MKTIKRTAEYIFGKVFVFSTRFSETLFQRDFCSSLPNLNGLKMVFSPSFITRGECKQLELTCLYISNCLVDDEDKSLSIPKDSCRVQLN